MTSTYETSVRPSSLSCAVRTVDRWGLVAGVTGFLGNVLLVVLFTTPADGPYAWTGPANDTIGVVSTLTLIPVAVGLLAVCGNGPGLGAVTSLAIVAMVVLAAVSLLFVLGLAPFAADVDGSYIGLAFIFGWVLAASRAGRASGRAAPPDRELRPGPGRGRAGWGSAAHGVAADASPLADLGHHLRRRIADRHPGGSLPGLADRPVLPVAWSPDRPGRLPGGVGLTLEGRSSSPSGPSGRACVFRGPFERVVCDGLPSGGGAGPVVSAFELEVLGERG